MEYSLVAPGDRAPSFTLPDDAGHPVSLESFRGHRVVLYFYPKDATTGCTIEACEFRDRFPRLRAQGVVVLGVSPDPLKSHVKFKTAHRLPFPLLSDTGHGVLEAYGVWREKMLYGRRYMGVMRTTYVISPDGIVEHVWEKVDHEGHAAEVDAFLRGEAPPDRVRSARGGGGARAKSGPKGTRKPGSTARSEAGSRPAAKKK